MNEMPKDPMMLMSFINMKLRDFYPSLDDLCADMDVDKRALEHKERPGGICRLLTWSVRKAGYGKRCMGLHAPSHITDFFVRLLIVRRYDL